MRSRSLSSLVGLAVLTFVAHGCRVAPTRGPVSHAEKPPQIEPVSRAVVLWSEAVLRQDTRPVAQGFAAKLYLYGPVSDRPVAGRGKLTVYAYNDTDVRPASLEQRSPKPDQSWEFQESELGSLLKKDAIGWYYPLWLPCGPPAPTERRYTLMLRFNADNNPPVLSESALVTLPAVRGAKPEAPSRAAPSAQRHDESGT